MGDDGLEQIFEIADEVAKWAIPAIIVLVLGVAVGVLWA